MTKKTRGEPLTDQEEALQADYEWARRDPVVRQKYLGQVVAVSGRTVVASARSLAELKGILDRRRGGTLAGR